MLEPVAQTDLLAAALAGAMTVIAGAGYAMLFAFSKLYGNPFLLAWAYTFYAALAISVYVLADTLYLAGYWRFLVAMLLLGYLLAPHGIWHLCVATHKHTKTGTPTSTGGRHE